MAVLSEEIFCDDITTGASNDLERATKMARAIVTQYGMSAELGTQVFGQPNHEVFLGRDYGNTQDYSEETAKRIDDEVARIMKEAHDRAYDILSAHREQMDLMASVLLERETVEGEACQALLDNTWDDYLKHEDEIIAQQEREEAEARKRDEEMEQQILQHAAEGQHPGEYIQPLQGDMPLQPYQPGMSQQPMQPGVPTQPMQPGVPQQPAPLQPEAQQPAEPQAPQPAKTPQSEVAEQVSQPEAEEQKPQSEAEQKDGDK